MDDILNDIAGLSAQIRHAEKLNARRLQLVSKARAAGHTWDEIEIASGLTPQGLRAALKKAGLPSAGNPRFHRPSNKES